MEGNKFRAIETNYMNYRFRSRLEARWAVFFETLGWDWHYEKQGYVIGWCGDGTLPWLPDFEVVTPMGQHFYVEVKGDPNFFVDGGWLAHFDYGGGPPGFQDCGWSDKYDAERKPLLLLGDIPRFDTHNVDFFVPVIVHYKGIRSVRGLISDHGLHMRRDFDESCIETDGLKDFQISLSYASYPFPRVIEAMRAASGARFEHGERGASYGG